MEEVLNEPEAPKPPRIGMYVAVLIEAAIVGLFVAQKSWFGLSLCAAYAWFSATWSFFAVIAKEAKRANRP